MRSARNFGLIAAITLGSLLTTGLGAAASPRQTGLDIPAPPETELNEVFTPPASAKGKPAGKASAPKTAWEADF